MWAEAPGNALLGLTDTIGLDDEIIALIDWLSRHQKRSAKTFWLIPGVDEMLKTTQRTLPHVGCQRAGRERDDAVSGAVRPVQNISTRSSPVSPPRTQKPYPDPILLAAQQMNVKPGECLMIGDTTVDMRAGKSAGAQTVGSAVRFWRGTGIEKKRGGYDTETTSELAGLLLNQTDGRL
jgi:N-acetyl-D-muramate 6-phosphate phosphatase